MARPLLIVDDDPGIVRGLRWSFEGYEVLTAGDRETAVELVERHRPAVVTLDLGLPPEPDDTAEGFRALEAILGAAPDTKVIMVTGKNERQHALRAIGLGAYDFYQKPIDAEILNLIVDRAFHIHELQEENRQLQQSRVASLPDLITSSPRMQAICRTIERVAPSDISVLLLGESGTGKELLARALHHFSPRVNGPFVAINCAAIPETLLESELFGHEKGAFTGALRQVKGKIELAHRGTLFLDEIGDMPLPLQAKMLRFVQERCIERVGGRESIPVDVRIVSATHQDLKARIACQQFREDIFYRIGEVAITIPALRDRDEDVVMLAQHFIDHYARKEGRPPPRLSNGAIVSLRRHAWPGNVRELINRIKRAIIMASDGAVAAADLDLEAEAQAPGTSNLPTLREAREIADRQALLRALDISQGNLSSAAKILDISRPTIYALLKAHGIKPHAQSE